MADCRRSRLRLNATADCDSVLSRDAEALSVFQPQGCQAATPDAAGVQRMDIRDTGMTFQCGPVSEQQLCTG